MIGFAKKILRPVRDRIRSSFFDKKLRARIQNHSPATLDSFSFEDFKRKIIVFIRSNQVDQMHYLYKYSASCTKPTLYASAYALMTLSLLGELDKLSAQDKEEWRQYFDSFQSASDGLFYDPFVINDIYSKIDWWGARHITLHMISAYTELGFRPKYPFIEVFQYYDNSEINSLIDSIDWMSSEIGAGDIDNKIMNIGCMLQYQRDSWGDIGAANAINELKLALRSKINPETGMWGVFDAKNPDQRSRMIQFAYHIFLLFFYDNDFNFNFEKIVFHTLSTQNQLGGYGVKPNSSACEDIDSIDILVRLYQFCNESVQKKIDESILRSLPWVLSNQVSDGGFVFRLYESFVYGSPETSSGIDQGAMLPTWFRLLSLAYISMHTKGIHFPLKITNAPGYEFMFSKES